MILFYLDVQLPGFLSNVLNNGDARHREPQRIREGSLEPIRDGLANTVLHGQAKHIPIEAPAPPKPTKDMVQSIT